MKNYQLAENYFEMALHLNKNYFNNHSNLDYKINRNLASIAILKKDNLKAKVYLTKILEKYPDDSYCNYWIKRI
jgi:tetratricopeptide (TPR) repeat protein